MRSDGVAPFPLHLHTNAYKWHVGLGSLSLRTETLLPKQLMKWNRTYNIAKADVLVLLLLTNATETCSPHSVPTTVWDAGMAAKSSK